MSTKKSQTDALSPRQVTMVFEEIASTAGVLEQLTSALSAGVFDSQEDAEAVQAAAQKLTQHIGLLAELYGARCGEMRPILVKGGLDAWLMPRSFATQ